MDVAMVTNFMVKSGRSWPTHFIRHLGILKQSGILQFQFQKGSSAMIWLQCV